MFKSDLTTYRHALHPFFERAGRGVVNVCSEANRGVAGGGWSCGVGCDIPGDLFNDQLFMFLYRRRGQVTVDGVGKEEFVGGGLPLASQGIPGVCLDMRHLFPTSFQVHPINHPSHPDV